MITLRLQLLFIYELLDELDKLLDVQERGSFILNI